MVRRIYYYDGKLTLDILKQLPPRTTFAEGYGRYPQFSRDFDIHWVAIRGGIHDWALYYHNSDRSTEEVEQNGDKAFTESIIKELVPCTDEAFKMYRF